MMREAKLILPELGNDGSSLRSVHAELAYRLTKLYGGVTITDGLGIWGDTADGGVDIQRETVKIYTVAVLADAPTAVGRGIFHAIATEFGRKAGQKAVYAVWTDGTASIIPVPPMKTLAQVQAEPRDAA